MGLYESKMGSDTASEELTEELQTAQPSAYNRFKTDISNIVYRCTYGKCGTSKKEPKCQFSESKTE